MNKVAKLIVNFVLIVIIVVGVAVGNSIAFRYEGEINTLLAPPIVDEEAVQLSSSAGQEMSARIMEEGAVLLQNKDNTLPLDYDTVKKVNVFGWRSVDWIYGSEGQNASGGVAPEDDDFEKNVDIYKALNKYGIEYNQQLYDMYYRYVKPDHQSANLKAVHISTLISLREPKITDRAYYTDDLLTYTENFSDTAIVVIGRMAGEGMNANTTTQQKEGAGVTDDNTRHYLEISTEEEALLRYCGETFENVIVLLNVANPFECGFLETIPGIDSCLYIGFTGTRAASAIPKLLYGEVSPSGKTVDTFAYDMFTNPANVFLGGLTYTDYNRSYSDNVENIYIGYKWYETADTEGVWADVENIVYQEGIYMGYRYTETRYEDVVLGRKNVGDFVYSDAISYPFGYGLSYTTFEYSDLKVTYVPKESDRNLKDDKYVVEVTVTNTGDVAGKEAVQLYLQKPYIENGIEKASVELVDFGKTPLLEPDTSATITMEVDGRDLASYDAYVERGYVVDEGTYYLTVAADAHAAVNNILAAKGQTKQNNKAMDADGDTDMVYSTEKSRDVETYKTSVATGNVVTNQFDNADLNIYEGSDTEVEYISRSDWEGTVKYGLNADNTRTYDRVVVKPTEQMAVDLNKSWGGVGSTGKQPTLLPEEAKGGEYPTFGSTSTAYTLAMLRARTEEVDDGDPTNDEWIPYNDPMWDALLDQMSWDDLVYLLSYGQRMSRAIDSVSKPEVVDHNGGNGPNQSYSVGSNGLATRLDDPMKNESPVVYPCNGIVASTFNKELAYYYGCQWGEDMLWSGMSGLYGMGLNTHRSAYGGRNFEYYSEDPVLMGVIAGETTKGMATRGAYVYLKHCVLNDQETYRCGGFTWANEQTIREIYLRSYEIAISDYGAQCVMGGLNSIGMLGTGVQGFFNTVLRDEFGMTGIAVTDTTGAMGANFAVAVFYGNDLPDGGVNNDAFDFAKPKSEGGTGEYGNFAWAMRESAHRILYTVVHSNAMNGTAASDKVYTVTPPWVNVLTGAEIAIGVLFGLSVAAFGVSLFFNRKEFFCRGKQK